VKTGDQIPGEIIRKCFMSEKEFEDGYKRSMFWTEEKFMEEYRMHKIAMNHVAECAKIYIINNWKNIKDWSKLSIVITDGRSGEETDYFNNEENLDHHEHERTSRIWDKLMGELREKNKKRHNPILTMDDIVLDPTDGDFSVTINGKEHWWIENEEVIIIADYVESKIRTQNAEIE